MIKFHNLSILNVSAILDKAYDLYKIYSMEEEIKFKSFF